MGIISPGGDAVKVGDIMTAPAISISPEESVEVAARTLTHYNIGILPVCSADGKLRGLVTDRDLVIRCMASGRDPGQTKVKDIMSARITSVSADMEADAAAGLMGSQQVRRLPVVANGKLQGIVSLGDLAKRRESAEKATGALLQITSNPAGFEG